MEEFREIRRRPTDEEGKILLVSARLVVDDFEQSGVHGVEVEKLVRNDWGGRGG